MSTQDGNQPSLMSRLPFFGKRKAKDVSSSARESDGEDESQGPPKWSFGVLNDKTTIEVPGETSRSNHAWPGLTCSRFCVIACGLQE